MIVSRPTPSRPSSGSYSTPFCTNKTILSVERPSTQFAILLTIPWDVEDRGTPYKPNLLPCARAQTLPPVNVHFASFLDVQTLSWTFRPMLSFVCSKKVYRTDRASRFVSPFTFLVSLSPINSAIGPARSPSRFCILSHVFRSTPDCTVLIPNVPHAGHPPISPTRTLTQVPDHPHAPHDLPSATLPASPPSFALFPPRFDHTLS
jgi:hypothetical protein